MFPNGYSMKYNLAPPMISKRESETGHLVKRQFGPWMKTALGWLMKFRWLRGGGLDVFGKTEERAQERKMIEDYIEELDEICASLTPQNHTAAVVLASVPDEIRGYGHVKEKSIAEVRVIRQARRTAFRGPPSSTAQVAGSGGTARA
jgi:indolepyruvate ferredoxin oxidoreductase